MPIARSSPCWLSVAAAAVLLSGCGSGSPADPRSGLGGTVTIESTGTIDGFVRTDGLSDQRGSGAGVGDLDNEARGLAFRMIYSFDLREVPAGAVVTSVTLSVFLQGTVGDPFGNLGPVLVDHVDVGDTLDALDYSGNTLDENVGTLASGPLRIYRHLGVAASVQADRAAGRGRSQFRLRFPVDSNRDGGNDVLLLNDGEDSRGGGTVPLLEVTYVTP